MKDSVHSKKYPLICIYYFVFLYIGLCNIVGMIPFSLTVTSQYIITFQYSLGYFIGINILGIHFNREKYFALFFLGNVPFFIVPLLFLIEVVSYFARVISLGVRLFANMLAGHILLKILIGFC